MVSGWRYRSLSVTGTLVLTAITLLIANHPIPQQIVFVEGVPYLSRLSPTTVSNGYLFSAYATTTIIVLGSLWPLFKPQPRRILDTVLFVEQRVMIAILALATIGYFDYSFRIPRTTLILMGLMMVVVFPFWFVWIRQRTPHTERAILVGDDPQAMAAIWQEIDQELVGYVSPVLSRDFEGARSDGGKLHPVESAQSTSETTLERIAGLARLEEVLVEYDIDTVFLAFAASDRAEFFGALDICHKHGVTAKVHRDHVDNVLAESIGDGAIVDVQLEPLDVQDYIPKRLFDIAFSGVGLIVLSPVILLIAIAIKLDSPGPILYEQKRTAEFGDTFTIYKFRSMIPEAEAETGVKLSDEDAGETDPRVTRVGKVLRQTHLDEIPQLWSILIGRMSVVGPRPERPEWDPEMKESAVEWRKRWFVKPGLTGLAQINDVTGFEPEEKLRYDIEYIRRQSFWFDLKIVIRQIWMVLGDVLRFARYGKRDSETEN